MKLSKGAIVASVMAMLVSGVAMTAACSLRNSDLSPEGASPDPAALDESLEASGTQEATRSTSPSASGAADDASGQSAAGAASTGGEIADSELASLEAQLEAMESELGALALPDNDFGDIEALLD